MKIFKIWVIILAFVSSQLAWSLRPFIGDRKQPLEIFRARESNFYIAVIHSAVNLFEPEKVKDKEKQLQLNNQKPDSTLKNANDQ